MELACVKESGNVWTVLSFSSPAIRRTATEVMPKAALIVWLLAPMLEKEKCETTFLFLIFFPSPGQQQKDNNSLDLRERK